MYWLTHEDVIVGLNQTYQELDAPLFYLREFNTRHREDNPILADMAENAAQMILLVQETVLKLKNHI